MNTLRILSTFLIGCCLVIAQPVWAEDMHKPYSGSQAFERMKQLVGQWEVTMDMGKGPQTFPANYKLTSGGSVVIETMFEDTPMEMVNVYHDNSQKKLHMIHYCAGHNQPKMALIDVKENELNFDLTSEADIDVAHLEHMHAVSLRFDGPDRLTQVWTEYENGQQKKVVEIAYKRVQ